MRNCFYIIFVFTFFAINGYGQTLKQLNGQYAISYVQSTGGLNYEIRGIFLDNSNQYFSYQVAIGDRIMDSNGNTFEIINVSTSGSEVITSALGFDNLQPVLGMGLIFRPSSSGFPLITINTPPSILTNSLNTATLSIDNVIPKLQSGGSLPTAAGIVNDIIFNEGDFKLYKFDGSNWIPLSESDIPTSYSSPITTTPPGNKGDVIQSFWDSQYYVFDGSSWGAPKKTSGLPESAKFGDVFYVTTEKKLYMMDNEGSWTNISSASFPGGTEEDLPDAPEPGDLFFNTDKNTLYMYDINSVWVEVSTNGSNPSGIINPDPAHQEVKQGNLFFNTQDKRLYVFNGTDWSPTDNLLPRGQIYVGNSANVATPVALTGDATIATNGILTIAKKAISDEKLDKEFIPLSGFAVPLDDVLLGDGISNFKIVNLANPTISQDAATKGYVDNLFATPSILSLANNNFFVGNAANKAVATPKTAIPLSGFGPATTIVSLGGNKLTSVSDPTTDTDAATKKYVDTRVINPVNIRLTRDKFFIGGTSNTATEIDKNLIPISGFGAAAADVSFGNGPISHNIINLKDPVNAQDAATKNYIDKMEFTPEKLLLAKDFLFVGDGDGRASAVAQGTISLSGFGVPVADVSFGNKVLNNLGAPQNDNDAATKGYIDGLFAKPDGTLVLAPGDFFVGDLSGLAKSTPKYLIPISGFGKAQGPIDMGVINRINFLQDPIDPQDATTKKYVDEKTANPSSIALPTDHILVGVADQAEAILKGAVPVSDFGYAKAPLEMGKADAFHKIIYLADPTDPQDAATKAYVDSKGVNSGEVLPDKKDAKAGDIYYNETDNKLYVFDGDKWVVIGSETNSGEELPTAPDNNPKLGDVFYNTMDNTLYMYDGGKWAPIAGDGIGATIPDLPQNEFYIGDANNRAIPIEKGNISLSGFGAAEADIALGAQKITGLADPTADQDAATKAYVDSKMAETPTTPPTTPKDGDVYYNTGDKKLYVFDGANWVVIGGDTNSGEEPPTAPDDNPKLGDVFYNTTDNTLYMYDGTTWVPIAGEGGSSGEFPTTEPTNPKEGDVYFNIEDKNLYVFDGTSWVVIGSKGGGAGSGETLPTPDTDPKEGAVFYNTAEKTLYIYDGNAWVPIGKDENGNSILTLEENKFFIGNADDRAMAIDKNLIPLSGFGPAEADIALGDQKITGLAYPTEAQDAATKAYVDSKKVDVPEGDVNPTDPKVGDVFYNTKDNTLYIYDGTNWVPIGNDPEGNSILNLKKDHVFVGDVDDKAKPVEKSAIPISDFGEAAKDVSFGDGTADGNHKIVNLKDPTEAQDAATKSYVDSKGVNLGDELPENKDAKIGDIYYNTDNETLYVHNGTTWTPLVNKLEEGHMLVGDADNRPMPIAKKDILLNEFGSPSEDVSFASKDELGNLGNSVKLINLKDPTEAQDAATKAYVDEQMTGVTDGVMLKKIYASGDTEDKGIVDMAAMVNDHSVDANVPATAIFTDEKVKIGSADGIARYLSADDFEDDGTEIKVKLSVSKFEPIASGTLLGNNTGDASAPSALDSDQVKMMLELNRVDNTPDDEKRVLSATKLDPPLIINGKEHDGSADFTIDGDNLGDHKAMENIKMGDFSISKDGGAGKGLSFDDDGHAIFSKDVTVRSNFYTPSDQRLKTNVETLTEALESLDQLRGVRFEYIDQKKYVSGPKVGLIAQELQKVYPEMVSQGTDGFLKVDYTQLSAVLIQAVKEQQQQLKEQAQEIESLKSRMNTQEKQIEAILKRLGINK